MFSFKKIILFSFLNLITSFSWAYIPKEGSVSVLLSPLIMQTEFQPQSDQINNPYFGGLSLIAQGDLNDSGALEIGLFHFNKMYYIKSGGLELTEKTELVHVTLGYRYWMKSERKSEGDATVLGRHFAQQLNSTLDQTQINCIISGGEPTVVLAPETTRGLGGRNQQLTLALLDWFEQHGGWPTNAELAFVSGGTDGEDGPTDAAGAYVDQYVFAQMKSLQLDPADYLNRCDAYRFFEKTAGLIRTGPTGTNVCDLRVGLVRKNH